MSTARSKASPPASAPPAKLSSPRKPRPPADGRRARGDATRGKILGAALEIASLRGLDGLTIGPVAFASGVSKGHLAQLFGDRETLQLATLDAATELFGKSVLRQVEAAPTASERLSRYCLGWFDYVDRRVLPGGCLITAATSEFRTIAGPVRDRLIALRKERGEYLRAEIKAALAETGPTQRPPIDDLVHAIFAYQLAANVAALLGDKAAFGHAKRATVSLLESLGIPSRPAAH